MDVNEVRAEFAHELGVKLDDMLEAARFDGMRDEGGKKALQAAAQQLVELLAIVDRDMDSGAFNDVEGPLAVASMVKKYIGRARAVLEAGTLTAEQHRLMCQGRVQTLELLVSNFKKIHDMEKGKAELRKKIAEEGLPAEHSRQVGTAPDLPLRERRRLEAETDSKPPVPEAVAAPEAVQPTGDPQPQVGSSEAPQEAPRPVSELISLPTEADTGKAKRKGRSAKGG